jgi:hypothetical protein
MNGSWLRLTALAVVCACFIITCGKNDNVTTYRVVCDPATKLCWQDPQREAYNYDDQGMRAFEADQYCDELVLDGLMTGASRPSRSCAQSPRDSRARKQTAHAA